MKTLKKLSIITTLAILLFAVSACDNDDDWHYYNPPPDPPRNVNSITGDDRVDIFWDHNTESDLAGYRVYISDSYDGRYEEIGTTGEDYYIDYGARNGETYFYAVTAYDEAGNESELSPDEVFDTPRPEGFNEAVFDFFKFPESAGYDFSRYEIVEYNSLEADFFFENYEGTLWINVWADTDIQDMGETYDIYDVTWAPEDGWVPLQPDENVKYVQAREGHTYVIWTNTNNFAKIRIDQLTPERMVFDWAYQLVDGNPELQRNNEGDETLKKYNRSEVKKNR